jgi:hypothetical protein
MSNRKAHMDTIENTIQGFGQKTDREEQSGKRKIILTLELPRALLPAQSR